MSASGAQEGRTPARGGQEENDPEREPNGPVRCLKAYPASRGMPLGSGPTSISVNRRQYGAGNHTEETVMHYEDQMALPGGSIGSEDTSSQGTRWLAPGAADEARDETLERTTVRHGPGGWYVITAAKKARQGERAPRAICRCGPLKQWDDAERDLITATGAPAGSVGVELSDAQSAAVDRVMHEGLKAHVLDAAARWERPRKRWRSQARTCRRHGRTRTCWSSRTRPRDGSSKSCSRS